MRHGSTSVWMVTPQLAFFTSLARDVEADVCVIRGPATTLLAAVNTRKSRIDLHARCRR